MKFFFLQFSVINFPTILTDTSSVHTWSLKKLFEKLFDNVAGLQPTALNFAKKETPALAFS